MEPDKSVQLSAGTIRYRDTGRGEPIVFVHGLLVNGSLWRKVTPRLEQDFRCIVPDLPLGSHSTPMNADADLSPRGVARLIAEFLEALQLEHVTIVANDTGGAITQLLITEQPERVGRLVLTPCDAYENFLPPAFRGLQYAARVPGLLTLFLTPLRLRAPRRLPIAFGWLTKRRVPDEITDGWMAPYFADRGVRRDVRKVVRGIDSRDTLRAAEKLRDFHHPALLAWASEDRFFKLSFAQRLVGEFPNGRLELIEDSLTFVSEDQFERLAELIAAFVREPYDAAGADGSQSGGSTPGSTSALSGGK